jgi:hypothetical protein
MLLLLNGGALHITATTVAVYLLPEYQTRAAIYIVSGLLPLILLWKPGSLIGLLSVLPQQLLLISSGISIIVAITSQRYADGVLRGWKFIAADQMIYLIFAVFYAFESIDRFHERKA